jgi:hypothetical protein
MTEERDRDFDAISEKDIYLEARDRMQTALSSESTYRPKAKAAGVFREGNQWDNDVRTTVSMDEPQLTINLTDALVRRVVNNIKQQRPRGKAHPVNGEADIDTAEIINGIGRHVEYRSDAGVAYDVAADNQVTMGLGYCRLVAEYVSPDSFDKDLRILPIPDIFTVYMDPSSILPAGGDAMWCLISTQMKRTEYKRLYPRASNAEWNDSGRSPNTVDWESKEEIRLAEYFRIREKAENLYRIVRKDGTEYTRFESQLPSEEAMIAVGDQLMEKRESSRKRVEWFRLNGEKVVEREVLPGDYIPVFRAQGNVAHIDGRIYRRGMVAGMEDPQRMVNYGETAKVKRLGLAKQSQYMAAEGQLDGHPEWDSREPVVTLTWKPVTIMTAQGEVLLPPPQSLPPAQIEAGFAEFVQGMRTNLMAVAGMPSEPGADTQGTVVSGKAIQRRQGYSDQSHFQYYDNITLMIAQLWRVMLQWIPAYFSTERMQRIIGDDNQPRMVMINEKMSEGGVNKVKHDLSVGQYDVVMDTGPGYETKREEGAENLINLLSIPALAEIIAKQGPDLVFRSIDHPYMQELADRLVAQTPEGLKDVLESMPSRARALIQSMATQIQGLQQKLQQTEMDLKNGITKAHLAATVKAHDVEESNKTKRLDTLSRDQTKVETTKLQIEGKLRDTEIDATGKLLDTHLHGHYDEKAADRMISQGEKAESNGAAK